MFCLVVIAMFVLLLWLAGFMMRAWPLAFLGGLFWFVALLLGLAAAVFAIGLVVGWPLMYSTIAAERTDAFDGVSRGYAFTYQRPLHLVFFVLVATAIGLLAQAAMNLVVGSALSTTHAPAERGAGNGAYALALFDAAEPPIGAPLNGVARAGQSMVYFWSSLLAAFATAFPMAYLWPAAMGIYLLLRRLIDSTELGEVNLEEGPPERSLPPLAADPATGVPAMTMASPSTVPATGAAGPASTGASAEPSTTVTHLRGGST